MSRLLPYILSLSVASQTSCLTASLWKSRVSVSFIACETSQRCGSVTDLPSVLSSVSDLIYNVLDLVPVSQVKQLVRSLGVRDTEIEQVQLDYRSCREAHYQMLRTWAERGPRAGVLLHPPLLLQLVNELRKMNLEQAAQELETNYGFT